MPGCSYLWKTWQRAAIWVHPSQLWCSCAVPACGQSEYSTAGCLVSSDWGQWTFLVLKCRDYWQKTPTASQPVNAFYFSFQVKMYTLNDKSVFLTWTVQWEVITLIANSWRFTLPAVPRLHDSRSEAVHDGAILSLMFHQFQKYFIFLVVKSV